MHVVVLLHLVLGALLAFASAKPTRTSSHAKRDPQFVTTENGHFTVNGAPLNFVGTNAYWLHTLNTDEDIDKTLANISASGIKVVRTWAFNDVNAIPQNGSWFQLIANGTATVNTGPNGLQRLDKVVQLAEKHGLFLLMSLTNNWNPLPLLDDFTDSAGGPVRRDVTQGTNNTLPRNTLSNDYGGMDVYIRELGGPHQHDQFYVNDTLISAFKNYTTQVVSRYCKSPAIFAWEIANDPRCNSTVPADSSCNTKTVTKWHSEIAQHIKSVDTNHLVSSGSGGFFCVGCPKLFPRVTTPPPQISAAPNGRRRNAARSLTKARILQERTIARKRTRNLKKRDSNEVGGIRIRGRWTSTPTRRQEDAQAVGPSFDGSHGVDSEDIINIPEIGFGSFQLFPDQNTYGVDDPNLSKLENTIQQGTAWIQQHAETSQAFGKPTTLNGFGLVTQDNAAKFVPFDTSIAPFGSDQASVQTPVSQQPFGVTDQQRDDAYSQWLSTGLTSGLTSMIQYQWSQDGLTSAPGTTVSPAITESGVSPLQSSTGVSPNDGYGINGSGQQGVIETIQQAAQSFERDT